jgi:predicted dehydrogenase
MALTRRTFLCSSAVVYHLAGPAPSPAFQDTVNLGFIGSGIRGKQLIDEFLEVKGVRGIAVADLYDGCLERAKEQLGDGIAASKDYRAILDNKDVHAVVIATPDHWHERIVLDALSAGKHVYIEKPMTWSIPEGLRIMDAAAKSKLVLQVGSQGKTSVLAAKAKEIVASDALGKVNMIRMASHRNNAEGAWVYPIPPDASEQTIDWPRFLGRTPKKSFDPKIFFRWRCWWEYSGGVATDLFVHLFTTLHEIMNVKAPVSAVSQGGIYLWKDGRTVPDVMNSIVEYPEGFLLDLYVNLGNSAQPRGIMIYGSEGTLDVEGEKLTLIPEPQFSEAQEYGSLNFPKRLRDEYLAKFSRQDYPQPQPKVIPVEAGPSHNWYFIDSIVNGKPSRENAMEGHYAAAAAHLCNHAYRNGRKAVWDIATGRLRS